MKYEHTLVLDVSFMEITKLMKCINSLMWKSL